MSRSLAHGPQGTPVEGITTVDITADPLNYDADFRLLESKPGHVIYTDLTSPIDQPNTLRISISERANVYAGTSIDPSVFLPTRKGMDIIIESRGVWKESDSTDPTFVHLMPVRAALTLTLPTCDLIDASQVNALVERVTAALFDQGATTTATGISALLHSVVEKRD